MKHYISYYRHSLLFFAWVMLVNNPYIKLAAWFVPTILTLISLFRFLQHIGWIQGWQQL